MDREPPRAPRVAVITVAYQPGSEIEDFVDSLPLATNAQAKVLIVNNGGASEILDRIAHRPAIPVTVLDNPDGNVGYGRALNLGAAHVEDEYDWLVLANPDLHWGEGSINTLIAAAAHYPNAGAFGPRILNSDGSIYPSARSQPSLRTGIGHALFTRLWPSNPWTRQYQAGVRAAERNEPLAVGWLSGACLLLRPEAWRAVAGFDPKYFMFFEDVDLGDRLQKAGWDNLYVPAAHVTHLQGSSWKHAPEPMIRAHHASARTFLFDRWGARWQAPVRAALAVGLRIRQTVEVRAAQRERQQSE